MDAIVALKKNHNILWIKFGHFWTNFLAIKILLKHSFKQHANKIMSSSPWLRLVDFALRLVNSVIHFLNLHDGLVNFLENSNHRRTVFRALQKFSLPRLWVYALEMTFGLLHSVYTVHVQLAQMASCKTDFFAPCLNKICFFFPGMPHQPKLHWWRNSRRIWTIPPSCTRDGQLLHQITPLIIRRRTSLLKALVLETRV